MAGSLFRLVCVFFPDLRSVMEGDRHIGISFRLRFFLDTFLCVLGLLSRLVFFGSFWIFFALGGCRGLILLLVRMVASGKCDFNPGVAGSVQILFSLLAPLCWFLLLSFFGWFRC